MFYRGMMLLAFAVLTASLVPAYAEPLDRVRVIAALPKLEALAQRTIETGGVPGLSIAVVYKGEVVYLKGFGLREAGKPDLVDKDTVFQIASLSKPISSTIVAAVVSEGLVDWDTRIADLDPSFALKDAYPTQQLTVRDLFNHRSGLPGTAGDDLEDIGFGRDVVISRLRLVPASSSFRAGYAYSNAGIAAGAIAAVKPTGLSWEDAAEAKLYGPLGMTSTSSRYSDFVARQNKSALHIGSIGNWQAKLKRDPSVQSPAGGVSSSARDLARWVQLELANGAIDGKQMISKTALAQTHVPLMARSHNPITGGASFYGLGWNVEFGRYGVTWGHAGAFSLGSRTLAMLYPESDLGIVVLTNAFPTGVPEGLADSFADLVFTGSVKADWTGKWDVLYASLFGPAIDAAKSTFGTKPQPATPALPLASYSGTYGNDYVGVGTVMAEGKTLTLRVGPEGKKVYPMLHFDRDTFLIYPDPEMADKPSPVFFVIGPNGHASSLTIDNVNSNGLGVLTRRR